MRNLGWSDRSGLPLSVHVTATDVARMTALISVIRAGISDIRIAQAMEVSDLKERAVSIPMRFHPANNRITGGQSRSPLGVNPQPNPGDVSPLPAYPSTPTDVPSIPWLAWSAGEVVGVVQPPHGSGQ
jgi:hypothetical protein